MLNQALNYLKLGYSIIPLKTHSKEPLLNWKEFQSRKATTEEVSGWLLKWPSMNVGVVTGSISGLAVVDLDGPEGIASGIALGLQSSLVSFTGNGKQLWHSLKEKILSNSVRAYPGVDVRGEGGYVVAPPSVHPNGKRYRFNRPVLSAEKLPLFPVSLFASDAVVISDANGRMEAEGGNPKGWIAKALEEMTNGNIDDTLFKVCSRLRNDGYSEADAIVLLSPHADRAGATTGHLEDKIRNVWGRYEPKQRSIQAFGNNVSTFSALVLHSPTNPDSLDGYVRRDVQSGAVEYIKTGFPTLDRFFEEGLKSERLFTVAALPGHGKTNFAIALAKNICEQGRKVLYFSTEYQYQKVWSRYLATLGPDSLGKFKKHAFFVCDIYSPNLNQIEEALIEAKPDVFIFDYVQHIGKEKEVLTDFMRGAQFLQRKYNIQGVIMAQLGRKADWVENGKRIEPRMSMIEGSSTLEQASSRVLLLSEVRINPEKNEVVGVLDKNDSGDKGLINFALYKNPYRMVEE